MLTLSFVKDTAPCGRTMFDVVLSVGAKLRFGASVVTVLVRFLLFVTLKYKAVVPLALMTVELSPLDMNFLDSRNAAEKVKCESRRLRCA